MTTNRKKNITIADVAHAAGVSTATVSRVINGSDRVLEETTRHITETIIKLGYIPQTAARNLASRKTNTIGVILLDLSGEFSSEVLKGIESAVYAHHFHLLITSHRKFDPNPWQQFPLGKHNTDGLIVFADTLSDNEIIQLHRVGLPLVLMYRDAPNNLPIPVINIENLQGTQCMMAHLIETHACKRIAFISGPKNNHDAILRLQGYQQALINHHLPVDAQLIAQGKYNEQTAYEIVNRWLDDGLQFDAIFGSSDECAIGAIKALQNRGISVPQDVCVTGFNNMLRASYNTPPLTTISAPTVEVGKAAVDQLMHIIQGKPAEENILLPTELVIRQSCGCKPV